MPLFFLCFRTKDSQNANLNPDTLVFLYFDKLLLQPDNAKQRLPTLQWVVSDFSYPSSEYR
ncbi:hypothetical protein PORCRE_431 [Porphyromonas crevioricanis JCM 15906]|uniref:Uncharacterized protein n=2 Tax=Porphyromonas crevioricanis TaxID=393921 RepID=A0AB34PFA6_9PORP|nr:hypothetical protein HQ38_08385 [Porphyromonas crevioricanis]GAD04735.1 hypothetical protein PORCRE_431 [Porphyromonas crevioricanis JCM 15906]GAD08070.1 hypothetical protein PORCAN_1704 [Porphyromonas crevioricanis JCM 13913]